MEDAEDRKKLYFLVQRLQKILNNKARAEESKNDASENKGSEPDQELSMDVKRALSAPKEIDEVVVAVVSKEKPRTGPVRDSTSSLGSEVSVNKSEDDLRALRRRSRPSIDPKGLRSSRESAAAAVTDEFDQVTSDAKAEDERKAVPTATRGGDKAARSLNRRASMGMSGSMDRLSFKDADGGPSGLPMPSNLVQRRSGSRLSLSSESLKALGQRERIGGGAKSGKERGRGGTDSASGSGLGSRASSRSSLSSGTEPPPPPPLSPAELVTGASFASIDAPAKEKRGAQEAKAVRAESPIQHVKAPLSPRNSTEKHKEKDKEKWPTSAEQREVGNSVPPPLPPSAPLAAQVQEDEEDVQEYRVSANYTAESVHDLEVEDMAIRVVVRKRPLNRNERNRGDRDVLEALPGGQVLMHEPRTRVDLTRVVETSHFVFDDSFESGDSNETIYARTVKPLVNFAFEGGKASCFAYGQTGSGKTFTLMGANPENPVDAKTNAGLYVLAARDLFRTLELPPYVGLCCHLSCFEIYGGKLFDLLNERHLVKCLEDSRGNVRIPALKEFEVGSVQGLLGYMAQAHDSRSTGATGANETSSRSHLVMQLLLKKKVEQKATAASGPSSKARRRSTFKEMSAIEEELGPDGHGKITFIDLAGSERGADTNENSKKTRLEGADINTSLLALKEVIRALANRALEKKGLGVGPKQVHTPFRGSKLTQVLKDSFVGDLTRTCMIACVSPAHSNCEHTLNTLRYADRVKEHQTNPDTVAEHAHFEEGEDSAGGENSISTHNAQVQRRPSKGDAHSPPRHHKRGSSIEASRPTTSSGTSTSTASAVRASPARISKRPSTSAGIPPHAGAAAPTEAAPVRHSSGGSVPRNVLAPSLSSKTAGSPQRNGSVGARAVTTATATTTAAGIGASSSDLAVDVPQLVSTPAVLTAQSRAPGVAAKTRPGTSIEGRVSETGAAEETETWRDIEEEEDAEDASAETLSRTVSLLSAHKKSIADTVEDMKGEMQLVQSMEDSEDRNVSRYVEELAAMLRRKEATVKALREQVAAFKSYRRANKQ